MKVFELIVSCQLSSVVAKETGSSRSFYGGVEGVSAEIIEYRMWEFGDVNISRCNLWWCSVVVKNAEVRM